MIEVKKLDAQVALKGVESTIYVSGKYLYIDVDLAKLIPTESHILEPELERDVLPKTYSMYTIEGKDHKKKISYVETYKLVELVEYVYAYTNEMMLARFMDNIGELIN